MKTTLITLVVVAILYQVKSGAARPEMTLAGLPVLQVRAEPNVTGEVSPTPAGGNFFSNILTMFQALLMGDIGKAMTLLPAFGSSGQTQAVLDLMMAVSDISKPDFNIGVTIQRVIAAIGKLLTNTSR